MQTTSQKHAKLKALAKKQATAIWEMLRLADEILADHEYVDSVGGEGALMDSLEADEFAHFGGDPSLSEMLRAYRANPKRETWSEYRFNVRAMIELAKPPKGEAVERINWKALAKELQAKLEASEAALADSKKTVAELRAKVDTLTAEASELRGELRALARRAA